MSAAAEYYGYLLSQGYGEEQIARFAYFADQANKGVISHNQAYRQALAEGWSNGDGKFKDWLNRANDQGWIDKGLGVLGGLAAIGLSRRQGGGGAMGGGQDYCLTNPQDPICGGQQPNRTGLWILGGVAVIGVGVAIYFATKKDD